MTRARDLAAGTFEQATGGVLKLETSDTTVTDGSVLGKIEFKAPDEASGTDAILVGAAIEAVAEGTFAADNNATELVFKTGASAAADAKMILDSSGNLLVGTTSLTAPISSSGGAGVVIKASNGQIYAGGADYQPLTLSRQTSDGIIIQLRKDGSEVGSIGTHSTQTYIGTGDTGIYFNAGNDSVDPYNPSVPINRDNAISLGAASRRFKDLYLSGGVYLGGTGAANKLDDYEEGTFSPTLGGSASNPTVTYSTQYGYYTKIGRMVYISLRVRASAYSGGSGSLQIGNIPFTPTSGPQHNIGGTFSSNVSWGTGNTQLMPWALDGIPKVQFRSFQNNAGNYDLLVSDYSANDYLDVNGWYFV